MVYVKIIPSVLINGLLQRTVALALLLPTVGACASLHHAQIGEIDGRPGYLRERFDVKVSEGQIDIKNANFVARNLTPQTTSDTNDFANLLSFFQTGPRTGSPVLSSSYARNLYTIIRKACLRGWPIDLVIVRESNSYPGVNGEIIRILGQCQISD